MAKQTITGKAFEYALLKAFEERLTNLTQVEVIESEPLYTAKRCFANISEREQASNLLSASFAVNFLLDIEPRLQHSLGTDDILQLEIVADKEGQEGDVRDVLAIRLKQQWEIGVSAKHNHRAVKHPRLSTKINFAKQWLNLSCSDEYMSTIRTIFEPLEAIRKNSRATAKWTSLGDYHKSIYRPILDAFITELKRLNEECPGIIAGRLVQYLIGNRDFYKVIKQRDKVEIQAYNLHGTLNQSIGKCKPKAKIAQLKLPKKILDINYANNSDNTLLIVMDEGWQMSFRIHNASSRIESSLKFDINLVSSPHTLFTNQLLLPKA